MKRNGFKFLGKDYMDWEDIQHEFNKLNSDAIKICELIRDEEDVYAEFELLDVNGAIKELSFLTDKDIFKEINENNINEILRFSFDNCKEIVARYYRSTYNFGEEFVVDGLEASYNGVGIVFDFIEEEKSNK